MELMKSVHDEVSRIVAEWRKERPELDVSALEVLSRVTRLARHLDRARKSAFAKHGLEAWSFDVLAGLRRTGKPYELSPGQLLQQTLVTSGTMTNRIDRLQELGFVERRPEPNDGRGILVRLTPTGKEVVDSALDDLLASEEKLLAKLSKAERQQLAQLLCTVLLPFDSADQPST
jgi:DNA-binding MarR family transcriptional regulator